MNWKKIIYIASGIVVAAILLYNSVYLMSMAEHTEQLKANTFDPQKAVALFWEEAPDKLPGKAIDLETFDKLLSANPQDLAAKHGKTLGIGAPYSVLVKGTAKIIEIKDEMVKLQTNSNVDYTLRISSIFSNTVREASGYFDLDQFETTMDFNLVALEINQRIVKGITAPIASQLAPHDTVEFLGAADIHLRKLPVRSVEIIPIQIKIIQHEQ